MQVLEPEPLRERLRRDAQALAERLAEADAASVE
jgi:hypothetical protein